MKRLITLACLALVASQAFAGITLITNRADIDATDDVRWEDKGPVGTFLGSSFLIDSHGTPFTLLVQGDSMTRYDMGNGWATGFDPGEPLLYNQGRLSITGAKTCSDIGMDIDSDPFGVFTAHMAAYDGLGSFLGSVSVNGVSGSGGVTPFIGVHSDISNIHTVVLWVTQNDQSVAFAVDHASYRCCEAVPEPASMALLGLGAAALLRRKKSS